MAKCECLEGCPFFNDRMASMPALADMMKNKYCLGDFSICARHIIFEKLGKEAVPADLHPNMMERAKQILNAAGA